MDSSLLAVLNRNHLRPWLAALATGALALIAFVTLGDTPFIRALGLALTVVGITQTLRRFGDLLAITGGLALAFSPAFWSQTGAADETAALIPVALATAGVAAALFTWLGRRPGLGFAVGLVVFVLLFWTLVGTPRSLRVTVFLSAWTLYLLMDALMLAHPRPDGPAPGAPSAQHTTGLLLLLAVGVLNDPLFILLVPAVIAGLLLSRVRLPAWYWGIVMLVIGIGLRGAVIQYLDSGWWLFPAAQAEALQIQVPYVMADGWREASRWINLFELVIGQFTLGGVLLGVVGLARLARWYPLLGEVTMIAYAAYALFGLVYFGRDSAVLLLPLLMIQVIWMTYAVHTLGQWLQKSAPRWQMVTRWLAPAAFTLLPILLLLRITGVS